MPTCCYEIYIDSDNTGFERIYQSDQLDDNNLILSPHLRKGTNKASIFDFTIFPGHPAYSSFQKVSTYVRLDRDGTTIFYGRVSEIKTDIYKQRDISCEGSLTFLKDSVLAPNTFMDITTEQASGKKAKSKRYPNGEPRMSVEAFFRSLITTHNSQMSGTSDINTRKQFTVGTVSVNKRDVMNTFEVTSYADISNVISSQLLGKYGGIIQTRYDWSTGTNYIDWIEDYTTTTNQAIEFGVNLLEIDSEKASDELWTMLLPIGADGVTIASVNNNSLYLPANPANDPMVQKYGKIIHYRKFEDASKASDLLSKATEYFNLHRKDYPDVLTVKAVDIHCLTPDAKQALDIGTKISVVSAPHGINIVRNCIEMDLDIQALENSTYTIGEVISPDEQGNSGKSTLSSKHSSSSRLAGTTYNELSDRIDGLQGDININADNIAITAQNMSISLQNLALDLIGDENHTGLITATANELRVEYNEKLYGTGGTASNPTGGIVTEYQSAISVTAQQLTSDYTEKMYGSGGTASNPTGGLMSDYRGLVTQTARNLTSDYTEKMYGSGGTASNPTGGIVGEYRSSFTQTAQQINSKVSFTDYTGNEIASRINQTATTILIQAQHINLDGYVTASQLSTTNANITNLVNGNTVASNLVATSLKGVSSVEIGDTNNSATLKYRGYEYKDILLKMTGITTSRLFLGYTASGYSDTVDLAHSHAVSVGTDGTVTLGGAVATDATNRSFKIADTKTYKDGVSAATATGAASVTVNTIRERSGINRQYNSSTHGTTIFLEAVASNGATKNGDFTISGTQAYNSGVSSVTVSSVRMNGSLSYNSSYNRYTVPVIGEASNGNTKTGNLQFVATDAYNSGHGDGYDEGYDEGYDTGYDDGYALGYSYAEQPLDPDVNAVDVNSCSINSKSRSGQSYYTIQLKIELSNGRTTYRTVYMSASDAYTAGYNSGYSDGESYGKSHVLNNFTVNDVYVYKVQNAYRADVRVHYNNTNYTRGNLTCVRGI